VGGNSRGKITGNETIRETEPGHWLCGGTRQGNFSPDGEKEEEAFISIWIDRERVPDGPGKTGGSRRNLPGVRRLIR